MSFVPVSFLIYLGIVGLTYGLAIALLLLSCGKLHRLEGISAWRIAWYCILVEAVFACISMTMSALSLFRFSSIGVAGWEEWYGTAMSILTNVIQIAGIVGMAALVTALAQPLRKSRHSEAESIQTS